MAIRFRIPVPCRLLLAIGLSLLVPRAAVPTLGQGLPDIAVVVHPDVRVDNLKLSELRLILRGDRDFWSSGVKLTRLIGAPKTRERDVFLKTCEMSPAQYRTYLISMDNRGELGKEPLVVPSPDKVVDMVSQTRGAIAFVEMPVTSRSVKVLKIDGKLPGLPGYPLR